jgi:hypothetical protein
MKRLQVLGCAKRRSMMQILAMKYPLTFMLKGKMTDQQTVPLKNSFPSKLYG